MISNSQQSFSKAEKITNKNIIQRLFDEGKKINSKNFYNNIKERRSVREFSKEKIDINIIKNSILSAGSAPSGANLQPWHFVVIKNKNVKKKIRIEAEKEEENFYRYKAPQEWLDALNPLGTDENKKLEEAGVYMHDEQQRGNWQDSEAERLLRAILKYAKQFLFDKGTYLLISNIFHFKIKFLLVSQM